MRVGVYVWSGNDCKAWPRLAGLWSGTGVEVLTDTSRQLVRTMICDYVPNTAELGFFCDARDDALELLLAFFLCICRFPRFLAAPLPIVNKSLQALGHFDQRRLVEDAVGQREVRCKVSG
jgi:hypothetical protein